MLTISSLENSDIVIIRDAFFTEYAVQLFNCLKSRGVNWSGNFRNPKSMIDITVGTGEKRGA